MTNYPALPYVDSCEQPHNQIPTPTPYRTPVGFAQYCRTCQPYFGYAHSGFCRYHEVYVNGLHNCPDYELRCCEPDVPVERENNETRETRPESDDLLTQLADMKRRMRSRRRRKRRVAAGD